MMTVINWIAAMAALSIPVVFFGWVLYDAIGSLREAIRISHRKGVRRPPSIQAYMPRNWGWYYVEYPDGTTGLATRGFCIGLAANFDDATVLRHPAAPWWAWVVRPRSGDMRRYKRPIVAAMEAT